MVTRFPGRGLFFGVTRGLASHAPAEHSMVDWSSCQAVEQHPERYGGAWVFCGTRVPVAALFENLEDDATVHQFVEWFPGVAREQVRAVLEHVARSH